MTTITTKMTNETTWEQIKNAALEIGAEVSTTLKDGTPITFELAALDVYGAKKVFVCKDCLPQEHAMNKTATNKGGWKASGMRKYMEKLLELLPDDLKAAIAPRTIKQELDGEIVESTDALWLPSVTEMFGPNSPGSDADVEDVHFPLYNTEKSRIKECDDHGTWWYWLRSPSRSYSHYFWIVNTTGGLNNYYGAYSSYGVCLGFCI